MIEKIVSPHRSFQGWQFKKWFVGNWITIKELIKVLLPAFVGWYATKNPAMTGFITILGKFVLDAGQYWFKEYTK